VERFITEIAQWATFIAQIAAIAIIISGMIFTLYFYTKNRIKKVTGYRSTLQSRLELGHSLSLGLSFLIGASILRSSISPTWDAIGKLSAIIAIRTILNYFLTREINSLGSVISNDQNGSIIDKGKQVSETMDE